MKILKETYTLNNGVKIPKLGFGTAPLKGKEAYEAIMEALEIGYRHLDTAYIYLNQEEVGQAIIDSGIPRDQIFVTSKLSADVKTYQGAIDQFNETMSKLKLDVLDLYLIHAPTPWGDQETDYSKGNIEAYKALEHLYQEGKVRAIGISNFNPSQIQNILDHTSIKPQVNQIKYHVGYLLNETITYCKMNDILIEAYSPLGRAQILEHPIIVEMAKKYQVSPAQLCLRFTLDMQTLPLPRSKNKTRIKENTLLDFTIESTDLMILSTIVIS
jgi:diketogulonate reductase-like aldo/keto reductase